MIADSRPGPPLQIDISATNRDDSRALVLPDCLSVHLGDQAAIQESTSSLRFLMVMLVGPLAVLLLASTIVMFDPDMMITDDDQDTYRAALASHATGTFSPARYVSRR